MIKKSILTKYLDRVLVEAEKKPPKKDKPKANTSWNKAYKGVTDYAGFNIINDMGKGGVIDALTSQGGDASTHLQQATVHVDTAAGKAYILGPDGSVQTLSPSQNYGSGGSNFLKDVTDDLKARQDGSTGDKEEADKATELDNAEALDGVMAETDRVEDPEKIGMSQAALDASFPPTLTFNSVDGGEWEMNSEEFAQTLSDQCKDPHATSHMKKYLDEFGRDGEHPGAEANSEIYEGYNTLINLAKDIEVDNDGNESIDWNDLSPEDKSLIKSARCRREGLFLGHKDGQSSNPPALPSVGKYQDKHRKIGKIGRDLDKYGLAVPSSQAICNRFKDVQMKNRESEGSVSPFIASSKISSKVPSKILGEGTEVVWAGLHAMLFQEDPTLAEEGIQQLHLLFSKIDNALKESESGLACPLSPDEWAMVGEYNTLQKEFGTYGDPAAFTRAFVEKRATEFHALMRIGGVIPANIRRPAGTPDEPDDQVVGWKRDIIMDFKTPQEAKKFARNLGLPPQVVVGASIDFSLKTYKSLYDDINLEGAVWSVVNGTSNMAHKNQQAEDFRNSWGTTLSRTNLPKKNQEQLLKDMDYAHQKDVEITESIENLLNEPDAYPAINTHLDGLKAKAKTDSERRAITKIQDNLYAIVGPGATPTSLQRSTLQRNLLSSSRKAVARKDMRYRRGAVAKDAMMAVGTMQPQALARVVDGDIHIADDDAVFNDIMNAVDSGRFEPSPHGSNVLDENGKSFFKIGLVAIPGNVRVRASLSGAHATNNYGQSMDSTEDAEAAKAAFMGPQQEPAPHEGGGTRKQSPEGAANVAAAKAKTSKTKKKSLKDWLVYTYEKNKSSGNDNTSLKG